MAVRIAAGLLLLLVGGGLFWLARSGRTRVLNPFMTGGFVGGILLVFLAIATSFNPTRQMREKARRINSQQGFSMETQKVVTGVANVPDVANVPEVAGVAGGQNIDVTGDHQDLRKESEGEEVVIPANEHLLDIRKPVAGRVQEQRGRASVDRTKSVDPIGGIQIGFGELLRPPVVSP
jgi:hypothetical protein